MQQKYYLIISLLAVILINGCIKQIQQEETIITSLNNSFKLKIDQVAIIEGESIKIKFLNITEDSRCPSDVVCVWEGQTTVIVNIMKDNKNLGIFTLTSRSGHPDLAIKNFDRYSIRLIKVEPYPKTTQKIETSHYVITLNVSKL
ncbi:MAG: hypothetical protein QXD48_00620 [Candidatus Aenigmatarchaeota archaeon]